MENVYPFTDNQTISEEAASWLIMLDGDKPLNRQSTAELHEWINRSPQHKARLKRLAATWGKLNVLTELAVPLDKPAKPHRHIAWLLTPRTGFAFASAAAIVLSIAVLFAWWLLPDNMSKTNGRYATTIGQQQLLTLGDGSTLQLNTNTVVNVVYSENYRDIHLLQGEAYFEVAKNRHKPFRVFAGKSRVQAVGTAFTVYIKNDDVAVTVTEGRVTLAGIHDQPPENRQAPSVVAAEDLGALIAGQGATLKSTPIAENDVAPKIHLDDLQMFRPEDLDRRLSWRRGLLVFSGEPLEQVVEEISRYTTLEIEIPQTEVRKIKVGGQFEVGDTEMMLEAFEDVFALKVVREENNRVLILAGKD